MTKRSFTASYKYQVRRIIFKPIIAVCIGMAALFIMTGFLNYAADGKFSFSGFGIPFFDALSYFAVFIFSSYFNEFINAGTANGVSRTTSIISAAASYFTVSAASVLFVSVVSPIVYALSPDGADMFLVEILYGDRNFFMLYGENAFVVRIRLFVIMTFLAFLCAMVGMLFSAAFYKLSRTGSIIFALIMIFIPCIGLPIANIYLEHKGIYLSVYIKEFFGAVGRVFGMAYLNGSQAGNCIKGCALMFLTSAVLGLISWFIVRRADSKPAAIKG